MSALSIASLDSHLQDHTRLAAALGWSSPETGNYTDSELLLCAYRKWGEDSLSQLSGSFAFVIDDPAKDFYFCARDHIGIKPFYYACEGQNFACAGTVEELLIHEWVDTTISTEAVAIYLARGELYHPELTFFEGIRKLPPGHCMAVSSSACTRRRYWRPEDSPSVRLDSLQEYSSSLYRLLRSAVSECLPRTGPVAVHLSGGLDSSAIAAIAAPALASRNQRCHSYSWMVPPVTDTQISSLEWSAGRQVADSAGCEHHFTSFAAKDLLEILETHDISGGDTVDLWYEFKVREAASKEGCSVLLSGWGGDQFASNSGIYAYADAFWHGNFSVLRELIQLARKGRRPLRRYVRLCWKMLVEPVLPGWLGGGNDLRDIPEYEFLGAAREEFAVYARGTADPVLNYTGVSVRQQQLAMHNSGHLVSRIEAWAASGSRAGINYRYPLLDKRIVEFSLGIPSRLYRKGGISRYIFRHAVSEILPAEVCWKNLKAEPERVQRLVDVCSDALHLWREKYGDIHADSPFIEPGKLVSLLDSIGQREKNTDKKLVLDIMTAIKSILVLNMCASERKN